MGAALLLACGPQTPTTVRCPETTPATAPTPQDSEPQAPPATDPATPTPSPAPAATSGVRPTKAFPIPSNCEAPLAITQEVSRLLTAAAAHGTRSAACVDGQGARLAINDLLVCPAAPADDHVVVQAFYVVTRYPEGDTRSCGNPAVDCSWLDPSSTEHLVELRFRRKGKTGQGTLVDPGGLPGFPPETTPLAETHDGDCYGDSPPFVAATISLKR